MSLVSLFSLKRATDSRVQIVLFFVNLYCKIKKKY